MTKLNKRKSKYQELDDKFGFLYRSESNSSETKLKIEKCLSSYCDEIEVDNFFDEFIQFQAYIESIDDVYQCKQNPHNQLKYLYEMNIQQTFPNVETILSIFLSIPCTNCSSERSFSVLERIKTRLRSILTEEGLDNLGLLSIESDLTSSLNFDDIINHFALKKNKKSNFIKQLISIISIKI